MQALRKAAGVLGVVLAISLFVLGFRAYFMERRLPAPPGGQAGEFVLVDGLGRGLSESPVFVRMMFGQERLWAGWAWALGDLAVFLAGASAVQHLFKLAYSKSD